MNVIFMGTPDFAVPVLQQLIDDHYHVIGVVTQPDRPKGRKRILTPPPVKQLALDHDLPIFQPEKIKHEEAIQQLTDLKPDLIVTCAYGQILPEAILKRPKYGCINVHASLLPEYRGGAPIHKAILDGKKLTGVTIMYMVKALDAGDMLTQVEVPIEEKDTVGALHDKLSAAGAKLLSETIPLLIEGELEPIPQNKESVTFAPTLKREDERIHWEMPGEQIYNKIRGLNPFPVAYTTYNAHTMKIWRAEKVSSNDSIQEDPGTIIAIEKDGFVVKSGDDIAIKITECQPEGKKRMAAEQFLRGTGVQIGDQLK